MKIQILIVAAVVLLAAEFAEGAKPKGKPGKKQEGVPDMQLGVMPPGWKPSKPGKKQEGVPDMELAVMPPGWKEPGDEDLGSEIYPPNTLFCPSGKVQCSCDADDQKRKSKDTKEAKDKKQPKGRALSDSDSNESDDSGSKYGRAHRRS